MPCDTLRLMNERGNIGNIEDSLGVKVSERDLIKVDTQSATN